jgi:phosphogluconate dehydratase
LPQLNATVDTVTTLVRQHSAVTRALYLQRMETTIAPGPVRKSLSCTNQAHAFAAFPQLEKNILVEMRQTDIPRLPGVFSPGEAMQAQELGFSALKIFPAKQAGVSACSRR